MDDGFCSVLVQYPIGSMYGIWLECMVNVGKYTVPYMGYDLILLFDAICDVHRSFTCTSSELMLAVNIAM